MNLQKGRLESGPRFSELAATYSTGRVNQGCSSDEPVGLTQAQVQKFIKNGLGRHITLQRSDRGQ